MMGCHGRWWWGLLLSLAIVSSVFTTELDSSPLDFDFEFETETDPGEGDEIILRAGTEEDSWPEIFHWPIEVPEPDLPSSPPLLLPHPEEIEEGGGGNPVVDSHALGNIVKEEVQLFNRELINFYREQSLREKRSYARFTYDIKLNPSNNYLEAKVSSAFAYPFLCHGQGFVLQSDGIYRLDGFGPTEQQSINYIEPVAYPKLTKINDEWSMGPGDRVLHIKEWERKCFVIVSNQNGTFSSIYTLHGENLIPINPPQQIRNYGIGTSGKFFTIKKNLFLVITNDNAVHSLTICPVFRWTGTYMDEIHTIQTRGAVDVETFTINSKEYIAIAQSQDSSGNFEIGTQVLLMDEKENLEKVQLLWSNNPVSLQYFQVLEEHYLLIGHAKEPSVSYVFGGLDFIPVQNLPNYFGPKLFMDSLLLPQDKGPLLLAAKSSNLHFYTWSSTSGSLVLNSNNSVTGFKYPAQKIVSAKFIRPAFNKIYLTLVQTDNSGNRATLKVLGVSLEKKEIAESVVKETESHLAKCLGDVRKKLDLDEVNLPGLEAETKKILTVDGHHTFVGSIHVADSIKINETVTTIETIDVIPEGFANREPLTIPSVVLESILEESRQLKTHILDQLPNILMSNKAGDITGDFIFLNELEVNDIKAPNISLKLEILNGIPLVDIIDHALKKNTEEPQVITGEWSVNKLTTSEVVVPTYLSDVEVNDFFLKKCPKRDADAEAQVITGRVVFKQDVQIQDGILMPGDAVVNGITISDLVMKNSPIKDILGFKHAPNLIGEDGFTFNFINGRNFPEWYDSVLHTEGPAQTSTGVKTLAGSKAHKITNLNPEYINGNKWEDFYNTVLRNVGDQEIDGVLHFNKLDVEALEAEAIGGVAFADLLSVNTTQQINSNITAGTLTIQRNFNLDTGLINDIPLIDSAVKKNEEGVVITGPVELENFKVSGNITLEEGGTIEGKDISELANLKRTQVYYSPRNQTVSFKAPLEVVNLATNTLNGYTLEALQNDFWSISRDNVIQGPLNLKGRKVSTLSDYRTGTLNGLRLEKDLVRVDELGQLTLPIPLNFVGDVVVLGDIILPDGGTLNGKDFSELAKDIVRTGDGRVISGVKTFTSKINAGAGAEIGLLNGIHIPEDLVFLNSPDNQFVTGLKTFKHKVSIDTLLTGVDVEVGGTVNGVDMLHLGETTAYKDNGPIRIHGNLIFNAPFSAFGLHVIRKINDFNITDLLQNVIFLDEEQVINFPVKIRNGGVIVEGPSTIKSINGIVLDDYLPRVVVSRDYAPDYVINGTKTFLNVQVDGDLICQSFNGISLTELKAHAFSLVHPQNVTGQFTFETLTVEDLGVQNIGGIKARDLVFINDPEACSVDSDITFVGDVIVAGPLHIDGLLNGHSADYILEGHEGGYYDREFTEIEVLGDLTWEHDRHDAEGISHFLQNAVTLDTDQEITGEVVFSQGFTANELDAYPWIDNVDLDKIQQDALHIGDEPWELEGNNTFLKGIIITEPTLTVQGLNARKINGIDLKAELGKIVWKDSQGVFHGVKHFPNGLDLEDLKVKDLNHKGDYSWLVTKSDNRTIDHMEFTNLEITGGLHYNKTKGFDLGSLLSNRVTRDGNEVIRGNYTIPSLNVQNDCHVEYINGIKVGDIFFNNATEKQVIGGKKTFKNGLTVDGNLFTPDLNGYNFATLGKDVYRKSLPQRVTLPFTLTSPVVIMDSLEIGNDINNHRIKDLKQKISHTIQGIESRAMEPPVSKPSAEKLSQIAELKGSLPPPPYWLEFLRLKQAWDVLGPQTRVEFSETLNGGIVSFHSNVELYEAGEGWRKGCLCNSVKMLEIEGPKILVDDGNFFPCKNAFVVSTSHHKKTLYSVVDSSVSYNKTCTNPNENSSLVVMKGDELLLNTSSIGYLSDAKGFFINGKEYMVLSYFFDAVKNSHDSFTLVYRIHSNKLTLVQRIKSSGPVRLAIYPFKSTYALAIANSRDPKTDGCLTNSGIYFWSPSSEKFNLVREVKTNGAVDVTFIEIEDHNPHIRKGHSLYFVAFAQNGNSADGEVVILQYNTTQESFFTVQSIRTNWSITSIDFVCVQENCHLLTVVPQEGIHFHEYRYIEGFQPSLTIPMLGASDIAVFTTGENNERLFFPIASTKGPMLAEAVISGFPQSEYIEDENGSGYVDPFDDISISLVY